MASIQNFAEFIFTLDLGHLDAVQGINAESMNSAKDRHESSVNQLLHLADELLL